MVDQPSRFDRFLEAVRRRGLLPAAAGYAVVAWILLQIGEVTFDPLHLPEWALTLLVVVVIAGFPVVLVIAWFFDITLKGLRKSDALSPAVFPGRLATAGPAGVAAEAPPGPSVAVLAFDDMSADRDQEYLCDGIAEEILNRLAKIKDLRVASRTSSFRFKQQPADVSDIGRQLKVGAVLEGSVRKSAHHLRITTQLINVEDGYHLWAQSYDRELADIFEIQDKIAEQVADALQVTLMTRGRGPGTTQDARAYEYYLNGLHYFHRWGVRNVNFAIEMFGKAVERDPDYAVAWAALADCHAFACLYWNATEEHLQAAARASSKALALAPELAEAHLSRGLTHAVHERQEEAIAEFEKALELAPDLFAAHYFYGRICFQQGDLERAAALFEKAEEVKPDDFQAPILLRQIYRSLGRPDDARAAAERGVERARQQLELNPDDTRALNLGLGGLAELGDREALHDWAQRSLAIDGENPDTLYNVACGYALVGERERALECLERASLRGVSIAQWAEHDSDLASLHEDPRFHALMKRLTSRKGGSA